MCEDPIMDETPHHVITECESLCLWRAETLLSYQLDDFPVWDPVGLIRFLSHKELILLETED